jgi:hypothetical protein
MRASFAATAERTVLQSTLQWAGSQLDAFEPTANVCRTTVRLVRTIPSHTDMEFLVRPQVKVRDRPFLSRL